MPEKLTLSSIGPSANQTKPSDLPRKHKKQPQIALVLDGIDSDTDILA